MKWISPRFIFKVERWKWNKEYRVYVSNLGNFKNEHKQNLPFLINQNGYIIIKTENGYKLAHRLVMLTFYPIPNAEDLTVDHKNHNKRDNSLDNLEWVTYEINQNRAREDQLSPSDEIKACKIIKIKAGKKQFQSMEQAIDWVINNTGNKSSESPAKRTNIAKKITNAINNNQLYCGMKWRRICQ